MKLTKERQRRIEDDLMLDVPFVKGQDKQITNCWHFSTDGNAVDLMFSGEDDFRDAMNRIYAVLKEYDVVILAFSLMDTHVHFVLHGDYDECNRFMHDYIKRTSMHIAAVHGERNKMSRVPINHQRVDTDAYLKTVICYTVRNAPVGGIPFNCYDYPWSSGPLYFRKVGYWCSPRWMTDSSEIQMGFHEYRETVKSQWKAPVTAQMIDDLIFPGEYVAYEIVERLFKTNKAYLFFIGRSREEDVDSRGGVISHLSIPMQEMRQHRTELCREMFGKNSIRYLDTSQRIRLAKILKAKYNSSLKQIIRLSGLIYSEVKDLM